MSEEQAPFPSPEGEQVKAGHTPGPWTAAHNGYFWDIRSERDGLISDACASNSIYRNGDLIPRNEAEAIAVANARLIAAAPELLEALEMVRDADNDCIADGLPTIPEIARRKIDAAIAKARGGAA